MILSLLKTSCCFSNNCIDYRIILTILIVVASVKRSFTKLKLLKFYLLFTLSQNRLNSLALFQFKMIFVNNLNFQ